MTLLAEYKARPEIKPYTGSEHELCAPHFVGEQYSFPLQELPLFPWGKATTTSKCATLSNCDNQQFLSQRPYNKPRTKQDSGRPVATQLRYTPKFHNRYNNPEGKSVLELPRGGADVHLESTLYDPSQVIGPAWGAVFSMHCAKQCTTTIAILEVDPFGRPQVEGSHFIIIMDSSL